jgi:CDP-diacylglycerol--serine O-phosphatidyltransferase
MGNMWCGYASIVYSLRGEFEIAAPFIGIAYGLDALDGRIARMTGTESDFGLQLDSLADVISFGLAPAVLSYYVGMPSPAAAAVPAATVYLYPYALIDYRVQLPALLMVLVPAVLMVSTIKYRSFKDLDLKSGRSFRVLVLIAAAIAAIWSHPRVVLIVAAYSYLLSGLVGFALGRLRRGRTSDVTPPAPPGA